MRFSTMLLIAGSMTAASPALAQNAEEPATHTDVRATNVAPRNEMTVVTPNETIAPPPETAAPAETAPPPAPAPAKRSFPWGVLGLLGLIGLFGQRNRTG